MTELLVIFAIVFGAFLVRWRIERRARINFFASRESLSHEEFGLAHFPSSPEIAADLRRMMEAKMGADMTRVVPGDPLLHPYLLGDELDPVEYLMDVEDRYSLTISDEEAEELRTLGDLVEFIAERSAKSPSA